MPVKIRIKKNSKQKHKTGEMINISPVLNFYGADEWTLPERWRG